MSWMIFILVGCAFADYDDDPPDLSDEKVIRCHDEVVDTGTKTKEGRKILKLVRTKCHWEWLLPRVKNDLHKV